MSNQVFPGYNYDTPVNIPAWTVQTSGTGSNQSLTPNAGVSGNAYLGTPLPAQTATGEASYVAPGTLPAAAKLSDLQALGALVDALNAALVTAGIEV